MVLKINYQNDVFITFKTPIELFSSKYYIVKKGIFNLYSTLFDLLEEILLKFTNLYYIKIDQSKIGYYELLYNKA